MSNNDHRIPTPAWRLAIGCCLVLFIQAAISAENSGAGLPKTTAAPTVAVQGNLDLAFDLFDSRDTFSATLVGSMNKFTVPVIKGEFRVAIAIQKQFLENDSVWLQILASPGGLGQYTELGRPLDLLTNLEGDRDSGKLIISGRLERTGESMVLSSAKLRWSDLSGRSQQRRNGVVSRPATRIAKKTDKLPADKLDSRLQSPESVEAALAIIRETLDRHGDQLHTVLRTKSGGDKAGVQSFSGISLLNVLDRNPGKHAQAAVLIRTDYQSSVSLQQVSDMSFEFQLQAPGVPPLLTIRTDSTEIAGARTLAGAGLQVLDMAIGQMWVSFRPSSLKAPTSTDFDLGWRAGSEPQLHLLPAEKLPQSGGRISSL